MAKPTGPDPAAAEPPRPAQPPASKETLWEDHPSEQGSGSESQPPVSLGPLALLGFGPQPKKSARGLLPQTWAHLIGTAAVVIIVAALKEARAILVPLVVSIFVATLTAPIFFYLGRRKVTAAIAEPAEIQLTLAILAGVTGLVASSLNAFVRTAPQYQDDLVALIVEVSERLQWLGLQIEPSKLLSVIQPSSAIQFAARLVSQVADLFSSALLILLLTVFVLFEALVFPEKIRRAVGDPATDLSQGLRVVRRVQAYVVVKTYTSLATGVVVGGALHLIGIDFALLWGLLAFLLNFIPNLGSIIAAIPAIMMAFLQFGVSGALLTSGIFLATNMIIGNFIEPRVMGRRMNLSPLIVFMSLIFWGWLWGPLGMLLSVPLTMVLRILLEGSPATKPFATLMAGTENKSALEVASAPAQKISSSR